MSKVRVRAARSRLRPRKQNSMSKPPAAPAPLTDEGPIFSQLTEQETRSANIAALSASGVFSADYYLTAYPDLSSLEMDPLVHFYDYGFAEGRRPNPYFDAQWYLSKYSDVAEAGLNPLLHYVRYGDIEGRQPSMLFNPTWYRATYSVPPDEVTLAHYLKNCRTGAVSPIPDFDIEFYAKHSPDVIAAGIDPFQHYISHGYTEGRAPSEIFDGRWYAHRYLNGDKSVNPFFHWLTNRDKPGVYGRMPEHETSIPREIRNFTRPSSNFEDFTPLPSSAPREAKILAMYLPQFHTFPENDQWWGRGFTEWTNLARGIPRFKGHYQPRVPRDLGFYDLGERSGLETMRRQARMAKDSGIFGFIYYYYSFNGKRLLEGPLDRMLEDPTIELPFALMWANENWTRRWDGAEQEVLISQDYRPSDDDVMLRDLARHFKDKRYIRLQGRPLLMLYRPGIIPEAKESISRWRSILRRDFSEDPIILMAQGFGDTDPTIFGLDGAVEFPPHKLTQTMRPINDELEYLDPEFKSKVYSYDLIVKESLEEPEPSFSLIKTAVPSWDNDARRQGNGLVITDSSPDKYQNWLASLVTRARKAKVFGESIVCINAWNEWCEGAYLEPDLHFGSAYLNATGRAVAGIADSRSLPYGLLLVGHDAFPSGAQYLLANLGRVLHRRHGLRIEFLLLGAGKLEGTYQEIAPTKVVTPGEKLDRALAEYGSRGFRRALLNTSATGVIAQALEVNGITPEVMLVHEMPGLLRQKNLVASAKEGFRFARNIIFPSHFVQSAVTELLGIPAAGHTIVMPQGSYKQLSPNAEGTNAFRRTLHLAPSDKLVLGVGYADMRKGFDLFLQIWRLVNAKKKVHFCWVGSVAPELNGWLSDEIAAATATGYFHLPGPMDDVASAYAASAAFLLTSREDPFPTVVLEALSVGTPVIAFDKSGGIPELLRNGDTGIVVPYADTVAMSKALEKLLAKPETPSTKNTRRLLVQQQFAFSSYVEKVLTIALPELPTISVAVPNYNYARYLPERLGSIFRQTHPVHEVVIQDDASKDNSLKVIEEVAADWKRDYKLVANTANSGSVFEQWFRAAEVSTGDWIWIAEADDSADPAFLAQLMATIGDDSNVVMGFSDSRTINADGSPQWESYKSYYATLGRDSLTSTQVFEGKEFVSRYLSIKNLILNVSAVVWRRKALLALLGSYKADLRNFRMAGDWFLYLQCLSMPGTKIAYDSSPLNIHRRHDQSVTHVLDVEKHVAEIRKCHSLVREKARGLPSATKKLQDAYILDVERQLQANKGAGAPRGEPKKAANSRRGGDHKERIVRPRRLRTA